MRRAPRPVGRFLPDRAIRHARNVRRTLRWRWSIAEELSLTKDILPVCVAVASIISTIVIFVRRADEGKFDKYDAVLVAVLAVVLAACVFYWVHFGGHSTLTL
ncbi:hypothetical protein [Dactylosporangium sp. NPDC051541]|uniref:hypothetical protein n=1 Tax=Dactylosporangium sp. NPDC051541 TaxID=3363977 RepID=UPI0037B80952